MAQRDFLFQSVFVIVVVCFVLATVESQTVTVYPPSVGAQNGEVNVSLACNATGLISTYYVQWIYYPGWSPTGILIYNTFNNVNNDPYNFTVNAAPPVGDTQSVELLINRLKPELTAPYECEITPVTGSYQYVNVIALDPLECPSGVIEYDEYNVANISCSVNFYDSTVLNPPIIMWYRDGLTVSGVEVIAESNTRRTARFALNVTSADDGQEFICIVEFPNSNPDYTDNCSTVVKVMPVLLVSVYPANVGVQRGARNVVLGCNVTGLPPNNYIEWIYYPSWDTTGITIYSTYTGVNTDPTNFTVLPLTIVGNTYSLNLIINTVKPELATQFLCDLSPTPDMGKSVQVIALDSVECSPGSAEYDEGDAANISCSVNFFGRDSTIDPRLTWYRDGQPISGSVFVDESETRKTLTLTKNVTSGDDDQEFVCVVDFLDSNPDYKDNCSSVVDVKFQMVTVYPSVVGAQRGEQNVVLGCNVTGLPPNNYIEWIYYPSWQPTGIVIYSTYSDVNIDPTNFTVPPLTTVDNTHSLDLVINTVKRDLATQYLCDITPTLYMGKPVEVVALDPVECFPGSAEYDEGDTANISCSVNIFGRESTNDPRLTWYRDELSITGGVFVDEANTRKTLTLTKSVTSADNNQKFVCVVDFVDSYPDYKDNCSSVVNVRGKQRHDE